MKLLSLTEVRALVPVTRQTLHAWVQEGLFPEPVKAGRRILWLEDEVQAWVEARKAERQRVGA